MIIDTRKVALDYRLSHWAEVIHGQSESGLSIKNYCEREGFHENRFYYWRKKLREATCEQALETEPGTLQVNNLPQRFSEAIIKNASKYMQSEGARQSGIHIIIAGIEITADNGYPASNLTELLKGLVQL